MGTRGAFGVVIGEKEKIGYNQYDSYPSGQGIDNLRWLRGEISAGNLDHLRKLAEDAKLVGEDDKPTVEDIANLAESTDLNVSEQSTEDWYCLTRGTHGHIGQMLNCGYIADHQNFPLDSLFCEWAYLVDFDAGTFEVYQGFQKEPHNEGRFAGRAPKGSQYEPVKLVASYPLDNLPTDEQFLADFEDEDE